MEAPHPGVGAGGHRARVVVPAEASAQAPSLGDFELRETEVDLQSRVDALAGQLVESDVGDVLAKANRPAVENGPCREQAFPGIPAGSRWFCFDGPDSGSGQGKSSGSRRVSARPRTPTTPRRATRCS